MKKVSGVFLCIIMLLGISGCGQKQYTNKEVGQILSDNGYAFDFGPIAGGFDFFISQKDTDTPHFYGMRLRNKEKSEWEYAIWYFNKRIAKEGYALLEPEYLKDVGEDEGKLQEDKQTALKKDMSDLLDNMGLNETYIIRYVKSQFK